MSDNPFDDLAYLVDAYRAFRDLAGEHLGPADPLLPFLDMLNARLQRIADTADNLGLLS